MAASASGASGAAGSRMDLDVPENEAHISSNLKIRKWVDQAVACLRDKGHASFTIKAMGNAISKAITVAEVAKRRIPGLHQVVAIDTLQVADRHQSKLAGVESAPAIRHVSVISITLYKEAPAAKGPGYQAPLPAAAAPLSAEAEAALLGEDEAGRPLRYTGRREARGRGPRGRGGRGRGRGGGLEGGRGEGEGGGGGVQAAAMQE